MAKTVTPIQVETLNHQDATRKNIPTAEYQSVMQKEKVSPFKLPMNGGTRIWIRSWSGGARICRTGPIWW